MNLRVAYGVAVASLALASGACSTRSLADELPQLNPPPAEAPDIGSPVHLAAVTNAITQVASAAEIAMPTPADTAATAPLQPSPPPLPATADKHHAANGQIAGIVSSVAHPDRAHIATSDGDAKVIHVRAIGPCQIGTAAWYGGRYIGRRTSSGEPLDQIHATAAHRTLPLNSLVRVTNLNNGRSVVVRITDRGPVSERLLIDMSPRAADELAMKTAGIVPVSIERVVEVADASK